MMLADSLQLIPRHETRKCEMQKQERQKKKGFETQNMPRRDPRRRARRRGGRKKRKTSAWNRRDKKRDPKEGWTRRKLLA